LKRYLFYKMPEENLYSILKFLADHSYNVTKFGYDRAHIAYFIWSA